MRAFNRFVSALFTVAAIAAPVVAAPVVYEVDPMHTFPSFEGDHMGLSVWRGKFTKSSGTVTLDRAANSGTVDIVIDANSIDFGLAAMHEHAINDTFLDVAKYPQVTYRGTLANFVDGAPTEVQGELTLHGVTRPVLLKVNSFRCVPHFVHKREVCGADAIGTFNRDDFGLSMGKDFGMKMEVVVRVQIEAVVPAAAP